MVASEVAPWAKTGGLGDVVAGLPDALDRLGHRVTCVVPLYRGVLLPRSASRSQAIQVGHTTYDITFHVAEIASRRRIVFVEAPPLFDRPGMYGERGLDYPDNDRRFAVLARAALEFAEGDQDDEPFDAVHAHDWQAGLVPAILRTERGRWRRLARAGLVFTIHNLAYQGVFGRDSVPALGLPWDVFRLDTGEFWGNFSFLKTGVAFSDFVTTVSPTYARETLRPEFGCGMEGVLHALGSRYLGILNGIDAIVWNPATDPWLPANYDVHDPSGKLACKRALLERFRLQVGDDVIRRPIVGMVSRLVEQKGLDLVYAAKDVLLAMDATWIFVGSGEPRYEQAVQALASQHPARVGVLIGFDEGLAHLVEAGADMFLMPSKFEPCGLNQMYSLRYGTVPIVHGVGGLADTVRDYSPRRTTSTGFVFREYTGEALLTALDRALRIFPDQPRWRALQLAGMRQDNSWDRSAQEYVKIYRRAIRNAGSTT